LIGAFFLRGGPFVLLPTRRLRRRLGCTHRLWHRVWERRRLTNGRRHLLHRLWSHLKIKFIIDLNGKVSDRIRFHLEWILLVISLRRCHRVSGSKRLRLGSQRGLRKHWRRRLLHRVRPLMERVKIVKEGV
jgi:hypothetical protein